MGGTRGDQKIARRIFLGGAAAAVVAAPHVVSRVRVLAAIWTRLILVVAVACTLVLGAAVHAQPAGKVARIGWFSPYAASDPEFQRGRDIFRMAFAELGYVEGQDITIEYRWAEGRANGCPTSRLNWLRPRSTSLLRMAVCHRLGLHSKRRGRFPSS